MGVLIAGFTPAITSAAVVAAVAPDLAAVGDSKQWQVINGEFSVVSANSRSLNQL
jgi:hypothetical protein